MSQGTVRSSEIDRLSEIDEMMKNIIGYWFMKGLEKESVCQIG